MEKYKNLYPEKQGIPTTHASLWVLVYSPYLGKLFSCPLYQHLTHTSTGEHCYKTVFLRALALWLGFRIMAKIDGYCMERLVTS
jgi:hypothetical protein